MHYKKICTVLPLFLLVSLMLYAGDPSVYIDFYSEKIQMGAHKDMVIDSRICAKNNCVKKYYEEMEKTNYQPLIKELMEVKSRLNLSDWLYYELLSNTVEKIWKPKEKMQQTLTKWFLLSKSGYETRISNAQLEVVFIHMLAKGNVLDIPKSRDGGKTYINITAFGDKINTDKCWLTQIKYVAPGKGKVMEFSGMQYPDIKPDVVKKKISFTYKGKEDSVDVEVDANVDALLQRYPKLDEEAYIDVSLSPTLKKSLLPQLEKRMASMTDQEKAEFLTAFCRTGFKYKWDFHLYDEKRAMAAEQVFIKEFSDHEDRCAVFFQLAKELTDLPILVIDYYDYYMTVGVALENPVGDPVPYKGKNYTICDPTAPANSGKIGKWPNGLTKKTAEVLKVYR